jgi:hypothetical protein
MELKITPVYAAFLGFIFIYLSILTIRARRNNKVAIGDGNNLALQRAIRVHGNFSEYTPLTILLVSFVELLDYHYLLINFLMLSFLLGRISHLYGVSKPKEDFRFRVFGMTITLAVIAISSILILVKRFF